MFDKLCDSAVKAPIIAPTGRACALCWSSRPLGVAALEVGHQRCSVPKALMAGGTHLTIECVIGRLWVECRNVRHDCVLALDTEGAERTRVTAGPWRCALQPVRQTLHPHVRSAPQRVIRVRPLLVLANAVQLKEVLRRDFLGLVELLEVCEELSTYGAHAVVLLGDAMRQTDLLVALAAREGVAGPQDCVAASLEAASLLLLARLLRALVDVVLVPNPVRVLRLVELDTLPAHGAIHASHVLHPRSRAAVQIIRPVLHAQ
mmetsp:Transcript_33026/g.72737  ORF Transcript_33026/g.72737 Transcript_33026/m.72737 type:complete len:261 (-) Transcript_33026:358-1140(-)